MRQKVTFQMTCYRCGDPFETSTHRATSFRVTCPACSALTTPRAGKEPKQCFACDAPDLTEFCAPCRDRTANIAYRAKLTIQALLDAKAADRVASGRERLTC